MMAVFSAKNCLLSAALASACLWTLTAKAETTLTYADQKNNAAQAFVIKIKPPHLRMDEAGGMWMLYDSQADVLFAVNPANQSYTRMDSSKAQQLGGMMDMMQEQLKNLPPEQRAAMEKMMGRSMTGNKPKVEYVMTGAKREVSGVPCEVGQLVSNGKLRHEFCVAEPKALGMPSADYAVMTKMFVLMGQMREAAGGLFDRDMPDPSEMKGVAVESNGPQGGHQRLSKVGHDPIAAEQFKIPTNYRQEVIPNLTP